MAFRPIDPARGRRPGPVPGSLRSTTLGTTGRACTPSTSTFWRYSGPGPGQIILRPCAKSPWGSAGQRGSAATFTSQQKPWSFSPKGFLSSKNSSSSPAPKDFMSFCSMAPVAAADDARGLFEPARRLLRAPEIAAFSPGKVSLARGPGRASRPYSLPDGRTTSIIAVFPRSVLSIFVELPILHLKDRQTSALAPHFHNRIRSEREPAGGHERVPRVAQGINRKILGERRRRTRRTSPASSMRSTRATATRSRPEENWPRPPAFYRTLFEHARTPIAVVEHDGTIVLANPTFERLSGYTKAELENRKKWTDFLVKEDGVPTSCEDAHPQ